MIKEKIAVAVVLTNVERALQILLLKAGLTWEKRR